MGHGTGSPQDTILMQMDGDGETNTDDDGEGETTDPNTTVAFESSRPQETLALKANLKKNSTAVRFHSQAQVFLL